MRYTIENKQPLPQEYCDLRKVAGLSPKTLEAAEISLPRSLFAVTIRDGERLIGMGRVIGDLGCFVQIVDIAVHPDFQGQKLGRVIMEHVMEFVKTECHRCAFVNLFADVGFLYQKFGFVNSVKSQGMYLDWSKV
ncbi:GNAT family N-acetyltransferase [Peredibacter starrii]|uniref:GNAT family N-acetyltransferase n=1 Tax=Peredibacter starrii TaxID=28202 RepID=A0AAX4HK51_9BACT|nr:GNAT family N-acetyltransferase [Peredibacter starrii]WPU63570.1 GNAT family N-acetyltransferase [Peredibacter starrii]